VFDSFHRFPSRLVGGLGFSTLIMCVSVHDDEDAKDSAFPCSFGYLKLGRSVVATHVYSSCQNSKGLAVGSPYQHVLGPSLSRPLWAAEPSSMVVYLTARY
jgi:hypothetical protein